MVATKTRKVWVPKTEDEKLVVQEQLDRLLLDDGFAKSERCADFLRFIVQRALADDADSIKERVLGIEVFGRNPNYDTINDPIVRVTASKIRKRISKYYEEPQHQEELRLSFPAGSYVPVFERSGDDIAMSASLSSMQAPSTEVPEVHTDQLSSPHADLEPADISYISTQQTKSPPRRPWLLATSAVMLVLAAITVTFFLRARHTDILTDFWGPLFRSQQPVFLCISDEPRGTRVLMDPSDPVLPPIDNHTLSTIDVDNVLPVTDLATMIASNHHAFNVQGQRKSTLADLSKGPDVFFGAFNNIWTLRFTKNLRFHLAGDPMSNISWIEDRKAPEDRRWLRDKRMVNTDTGRDFAIVARFDSADTGQPTVVIAGLSHNSNIAAANCLMSEACLAQLDRVAKPNWRKQNVEFVLEVSSVDGKTGKSVISIADTW